MKTIFTTILLLIASAASTTYAQFVYANDVCSGAIPLKVSADSRISDSLWLFDAYADNAFNNIPFCNGSTTTVRRDLWYIFTATDTALSINTRFFPPQAGVIGYQLFTGDCNNLTSVACYGSGISQRIGGLTIGQQYYLRSYYPNGIGNDPSVFNLNIISKPTNDECTSPLFLPVLDANTQSTSAQKYTNAMATRSTTSCNIADPGWPATNKDVWFAFVATASQHVVYIEAAADAEALVYSQSGGVFTYMGLFNFYSPTEAKTLTNLVPGNSYYIRFGAVAVKNFSISVFANAPPNDECANADTVKMSNSFDCENSFTVSNRWVATNSTGGCTGSTISKDVWFVFKATASAITLRALNGGNVRMGLLQGTCGALTCLQTITQDEASYSGLTIGNYYYLQVGGSGEETPITICISPAITNDECSGALTLAVKPYGIVRNTVAYTGNATESMPPCIIGASKDVWYKFTATDTAHLITIDGANRFQVFNGTCAALNPVYCGGSATQPLNAIARTEKVTGLLPGSSYFLWVNSNYSGAPTLVTIDVNELPANDECVGAKQLQPQQQLGYEPILDNGILQAAESLAPCSTANYRQDIWYKFVAPTSHVSIMSHMTNAIGNLNTLGLELYSGGCGSLTSVACIQQGQSVAHRVANFSTLAPGETYYIRQYGNIPDNTITIVTPPANDDITGAIQLFPSPAAVQNIPSYSCHATTKKFGRICTSTHLTMEHDTWFYFVAQAATHTVSTGHANSFWNEETVVAYQLEAFKGFAPDSASLAPKLINCATNSLSLSNLIIGDTVYLRVASMGEGITNIFTIKVSNALSMDEPAGAALLSKKDVYEYKVNTTGATQSLPSSGCMHADFADDDVWFAFNAAADVKRIVAGMESTGITLQLFSGTPGNLIPLLCSNNIMVLPANLTNGNLYHIRAYTKVNTTRGDFEIGLFTDADLYANTCGQAAATLGPNLVTNPRFEIEEPYLWPNISSGHGYPGRALAKGWWCASAATADTWGGDYPIGGLGNVPSVNGYGKNKIPRSGKSMLGMQSSSLGVVWNEYATGKLTQPLTQGKTYFVSFYMSFTEDYPNYAFNIGAWFNNDSTHNIGTNPLLVTPHVGMVPGSSINAKTKWYNICGYFTADKPYSFITIGNFGENGIYNGGVFNNYFFVDDVVVAEATDPTLPLTLFDFTGRLNASKQSELKWSTAAETNTSHFSIEWRTDATNFSSVGTVQAAGKNAGSNYHFMHSNPAIGANYYRLKMYDLDGQFTYSPVIKIMNNQSSGGLLAYPNPVRDVLNISVMMAQEERVLFSIVDSYGRIVGSQQKLLQKGKNVFGWNLRGLAAGNYILVSTSKGHATTKFIKIAEN